MENHPEDDEKVNEFDNGESELNKRTNPLVMDQVIRADDNTRNDISLLELKNFSADNHNSVVDYSKFGVEDNQDEELEGNDKISDISEAMKMFEVLSQELFNPVAILHMMLQKIQQFKPNLVFRYLLTFLSQSDSIEISDKLTFIWLVDAVYAKWNNPAFKFRYLLPGDKQVGEQLNKQLLEIITTITKKETEIDGAPFDFQRELILFIKKTSSVQNWNNSIMKMNIFRLLQLFEKELHSSMQKYTKQIMGHSHESKILKYESMSTRGLIKYQKLLEKREDLLNLSKTNLTAIINNINLDGDGTINQTIMQNPIQADENNTALVNGNQTFWLLPMMQTNQAQPLEPPPKIGADVSGPKDFRKKKSIFEKPEDPSVEVRKLNQDLKSLAQTISPHNNQATRLPDKQQRPTPPPLPPIDVPAGQMKQEDN